MFSIQFLKKNASVLCALGFDIFSGLFLKLLCLFSLYLNNYDTLKTSIDYSDIVVGF